jgi:predicted TIM-barrel fold metal-dependent hydrolase
MGGLPTAALCFMKIIDTHQHLWDLGRFKYSWTDSAPALNRTFTIDDYRSACEGTGITASVHVEADVDEPHMLDETRYLRTLAGGSTPIVGIVAAARPESLDFPSQLEQLTAYPEVKGIRRLLQSQPDDLSTSGIFRRHIRMLGDHGLRFDLCVQARQLSWVSKLVDACPDVQFVLDHCGNPPLRDGDIEKWRTDIHEISTSANVACKISGIVTQADHLKWHADDLRPAVEHVIDCFSWDRVMFGSDWPVCRLASSLRRWVETLKGLTAWAGETNQQKLFFENAERIYRL